MKAGPIAVTDSAAVLIVSGQGATMPQRRYCAIRVAAPDSSPVWFGGADVLNDGSNGFPLDSTFSAVNLDLEPGDKIYAICAVGTAKTVYFIRNEA